MYYEGKEFFKSLFHYGFENVALTISEIFNKEIKISLGNCFTGNDVFKLNNSITLKQCSYNEDKFIHIYFSMSDDDYLRFLYSLDAEKHIEHDEDFYLKKYYYEIANLITGNLINSLYNFFNIDYFSETPLTLKKNIILNLCKDQYIDMEVIFNINSNIIKTKTYACIDFYYWDEMKHLMEDIEYEV